jgi:ABC-type transporter Mla subunit MlaD
MEVERTIEFLLEQQAASQARFDAQMAEIRQILAETNRTLAETADIGRKTRAYLDRAIRAGVKEAREERRRRREADEKLAADQEALRQSMKAYFDRLTGTNGHDQQ